MLVDNGSSIKILFGATYDKMHISHGFIPMTIPLYGFTREYRSQMEDHIICGNGSTAIDGSSSNEIPYNGP